MQTVLNFWRYVYYTRYEYARVGFIKSVQKQQWFMQHCSSS